MKNDFELIVGKNIRRLREGASLTRATLAQRVGATETWVMQVEDGQRILGTGDLFYIADTLDVDCEQLLEGVWTCSKGITQ